MPTPSTRLYYPRLIPFGRIPPRQHQRGLRVLPLPVREFPCPHYTEFPPTVERARGSVNVVLCFGFGEPGGRDGHPLLLFERPTCNELHMRVGCRHLRNVLQRLSKPRYLTPRIN